MHKLMLKKKFFDRINHAPIPGYRKLEYIQSNGNQWIDTGINAETNLASEIDFEFVEVPTDACVLGARTSTERIYLMHCYPKKFCLGYGSYYSSSKSCVKDTRYKIYTELDYGLQYFWTEDDGIFFEKNISSEKNIHLNLHLFGMNESGRNAYRTKIKLYGCEIYYMIYNPDEEYRVLRKFVPVERISDGKPGLYDLVSRTFFTNQGTGEFTKGGYI